ncbi:Mis6-domain-containing protein [Tirmania nivea]|nr:Mis6-domain-containing protein [Tirmania nivea]
MCSSARSGGNSMPEIGGSRLGQVIDILRRAGYKRNEVPKEDLIDAVDEFAQYSSLRGLPEDSVNVMIDILTTPSKLDQATLATIVKHLYPRSKVSENVVVKIALLLRWLVMIYDVLDGHTILSQLYGLLFNCLDLISLRVHICHLLYLITRRKHVKPFRIQALLELKRIVGNEQPLLGLLQIYKDYYPDVIVERLPPTKAGLFSHPNPEWMQKLLVIQEANAVNSLVGPEKSSFQVVRKHGSQGGKRRKTGHLTVLEVHTYRAVESSVTLEEIGNVNDFVAKLDKLELPNQLVAVIEDPLLQKFLDLKLSEADQQRINNWLTAYLSCIVGGGAKERLLKRLLEYTNHTNNLLPAVENYLQKCLNTCIEPKQLDQVLELLTFLPMRTFEELYNSFFCFIDNIFCAHEASDKIRLIDFYTRLLRHWVLAHSLQLQSSTLSNDTEYTIIHYMRHVGFLIVEALRGSGSRQVTSSALTFYEVAASFPAKNSTFRLVLPPDSLVYHSLFAGDALSLSRLCGISAKYKRNAEETRRLSQSIHNNSLEPYSRAFTDHLNSVVMDIVNCIWRNRAFSTADNSLGCNIPKELIKKYGELANSRGEDLRQLYSPTRSIALARYSKAAFSALETRDSISIFNRHRGQLTQESLKNLAVAGGLNIPWREFKKETLKDLERRGLVGLPELIYSVIAVFSTE